MFFPHWNLRLLENSHQRHTTCQGKNRVIWNWRIDMNSQRFVGPFSLGGSIRSQIIQSILVFWDLKIGTGFLYERHSSSCLKSRIKWHLCLMMQSLIGETIHFFGANFISSSPRFYHQNKPKLFLLPSKKIFGFSFFCGHEFWNIFRPTFEKWNKFSLLLIFQPHSFCFYCQKKPVSQPVFTSDRPRFQVTKPLEINMESKFMKVWKMFFPFKQLIFRFQGLIFQVQMSQSHSFKALTQHSKYSSMLADITCLSDSSQKLFHKNIPCITM